MEFSSFSSSSSSSTTESSSSIEFSSYSSSSSSSESPQNVFFTNFNNSISNINHNDLIKTGGGAAWNASANATLMIDSGTSGYVEWVAENTTNNIGGTLAPYEDEHTVFTTRYGWFQIGTLVVAVENGIAVFFQAAAVAMGDTMRIRVNSDGKVAYEVNGTNLYNSQLRANSYYPMAFEAFINTPGASMLGTRISGNLTELIVDDE